MDINQLLIDIVEKDGSDLHISTGEKPIMRIDGDLQRVEEHEVLTHDMVQACLDEIMSDEQKKELEETKECDFSTGVKGSNSRFRVNAFLQDRGPAIAFRTIPEKVLTLEQLNAPDTFKQIADQPNGIVLVTGPTGSGKSTTLAAMIDHINKQQKGHILTIEDPIEFVHESKSCLINQREVKRDTLSFNNALKSALREDPDYILVGEMRDLETIRLALTAAETGHLVFATLHTSSAPKTVDRIINVFPAGEQSMIRAMLSESLRAVVAQKLLKKQGGGRVAAHEVLISNRAVANLIRENKIPQIYSVLQTNRAAGMQTLEQSLQTLVKQGLVSESHAKSCLADD